MMFEKSNSYGMIRSIAKTGTDLSDTQNTRQE